MTIEIRSTSHDLAVDLRTRPLNGVFISGGESAPKRGVPPIDLINITISVAASVPINV